MNKIIKTSLLSLFVFITLCGCLTSSNYNEDAIKKVVISPDRKYYLTIIDRESTMAFGTGWYELRLHSSYKILGKCLFGKFSFEISDWDIEKKEIIIKITENYSYIKGWTDKNKNIGIFNIKYQYIKLEEKEKE